MKFKNVKKKTHHKKYPSNSRTINDLQSRFPKIDNIILFKFYRRALKVFVALIFIVTAVVVGLDLQSNLQVKGSVDSQREVLISDLNFWKDFLTQHRNYPDAYFQISIVEYKLGDMTQAKMYAEKGLTLDPNSQDGIRLERFLVNK